MVNVREETILLVSFPREGQRGIGVSSQPWALSSSQLQNKSMAEPIEKKKMQETSL